MIFIPVIGHVGNQHPQVFGYRFKPALLVGTPEQTVQLVFCRDIYIYLLVPLAFTFFPVHILAA